MEQKVINRTLVNPVALRNAFLVIGENTYPILDLSFLRVVAEEIEPCPELVEEVSVPVEFRLDRLRFVLDVVLHARKDGWVRLGFDKLLASAHADLRSFLSPKRIGESIVEAPGSDELRHYHGLNESEIWVDPEKGILLTYLEPKEPSKQFVLCLANGETTLKVGQIRREDYMALENLYGELPLLPLTDREVYSKLGECRDLVTNFRPANPLEFSLKQRLLKVLSDHIYSTVNRFDFIPPNRPKTVTTLSDGQRGSL